MNRPMYQILFNVVVTLFVWTIIVLGGAAVFPLFRHLLGFPTILALIFSAATGFGLLALVFELLDRFFFLKIHWEVEPTPEGIAHNDDRIRVLLRVAKCLLSSLDKDTQANSQEVPVFNGVDLDELRNDLYSDSPSRADPYYDSVQAASSYLNRFTTAARDKSSDMEGIRWEEAINLIGYIVTSLEHRHPIDDDRVLSLSIDGRRRIDGRRA